MEQNVQAQDPPARPAHRLPNWRIVLTAVAVVLIPLVAPTPYAGLLRNFEAPKRLLWAALALSLLGTARPASFTRRCVPLLFVSVLGVWLTVRMLSTPNPWAGTDMVMTWLLCGALFAAGYAVGAKADVLWITRALGAGLIVQIFIVLFQRLGMQPIPTLAGGRQAAVAWRGVGTIGSESWAAAFLALAGGSFAFAQGEIVLPVVLVVVAAVISVTGSVLVAVTLLVAAFAGVAVWSVHGVRARRAGGARVLVAPLLVCGIMVLAFLVAAPMREGLFGGRAGGLTRTESAARALVARIARQMRGERALTGQGPGAYRRQYPARLAAALPAERTRDSLREAAATVRTHRDYLVFGAEFGWVGLLLLLAAFLAVAGSAWFGMKVRIGPGSAALFILLFMLVHGWVSHPWQTAAMGPMAGLLLGLCLSSTARPERDTGGPSPLGKGLGVLLRTVWLAAAVAVGLWSTSKAVLAVKVPNVWQPDRALALARKLMPWEYEYQARLGGFLTGSGRFTDALPLLQRAETGCWDAELARDLGRCRAGLGQWQQALAAWQAWSATGLRHDEALDSVATALEQLARFSEAADVLAERDRLWPDRGDGVGLRRCRLLRTAGREAEARDLLERALARRKEQGRPLPSEWVNLLESILPQPPEPETAAQQPELQPQANREKDD